MQLHVGFLDEGAGAAGERELPEQDQVGVLAEGAGRAF
jgi:hypothetical protein